MLLWKHMWHVQLEKCTFPISLMTSWNPYWYPIGLINNLHILFCICILIMLSVEACVAASQREHISCTVAYSHVLVIFLHNDYVNQSIVLCYCINSLISCCVDSETMGLWSFFSSHRQWVISNQKPIGHFTNRHFWPITSQKWVVKVHIILLNKYRGHMCIKFGQIWGGGLLHEY